MLTRLCNNLTRIVIVTTIVFLASVSAVGANSVWHETKSVNVAGATKTVNVVYINPNDRSIEIRPVLAKDQVGMTEPLSSMVSRTGAIAAVNGTFFNAYTDDRQPHGVIQQNGKMLHSGETGSVVGFNGANRLTIANLKPRITGGKNGSWEWPNSWYAWGFNHDTTTTNPEAVVIITPEHKGGRTSGENAISVVVSNGKVTSVVDAHVTIPADGYVIRIGKKAGNNLLTLFKVGDLVDYKVDFNAATPSGSVDWSQMRHAVGAGPILVHKGKVDVNFQRDNMPDPKLTTNVGMRSFIGVRSDGMLGIGTVNSVTVVQLANIVKDLGFVEAMNLDGGASSGLFFNNRAITTPGRELSNAIVFIKHPTNLPRINVNGKELFLDVLAYLDFIGGDRNKGVTMIPVRGVLEQTGAKITWDSLARKVTAVRGNMVVELVVGSDIAKVNGVNKKLDMPAVIKSNRVFVPIRFISEALGDAVTWNQNEFMVYIKSNATGGAPNLADILQRANKAHEDKQFAVASELYQQYVQLAPNVDETTYLRFGWSSYSAGKLDVALTAFTAYVTKYPNALGAHYGLAQTYSHNQIGNLEKAEIHYRKVIEISPNSEQAKVANEFINKLGTKLHQADVAFAQGNKALASELYTSYLTTNNSPTESSYSNWGWSSYDSRNSGTQYILNAEQAFKAYIRQFPNSSGGYYGLAVTYRLIHFDKTPGIKDLIKANYQKVIDLDPNSERARIAREYLNANP